MEKKGKKHKGKGTSRKNPNEKVKKNAESGIVGGICKDRDCHLHGNLKVRGRIFEGVVINKLPRRVTIEFQRMIYVRKYERYSKSKTKIHARLADCMKDKINVGDYISVQECRPLSKIIHATVINKIKSKGEIK
ncbi:MAG TPA: 30S ribosomal protein S17 [Candidatus Nanoarchaeia archaeon]|nr:30S ribosomal protein S17 [Candidatus Nanoarchaeia archaeon]